MTLEEAVQKLISLGERDPIEIARKIEKQNDKHWLRAELESLSEDIIAEIARRRLSGQRRSAEVALRPGNEVASSELKLKTFWIPGKGWIRAADLTVSDLRLRASWEEKLALSIGRRVEWLRETAELMESEGVQKLGQLKGTLPALPELEAVA